MGCCATTNKAGPGFAIMAEQLPLVRQWTILRTLSARRLGVTVKELSQEMRVNEKTIRRDLETFQTLGFPLKERVGKFRRKHWRLEAGDNAFGLAFAFDEALALYLGRRFLDPLAGTMLWEAAQRAFRKIRAMLSADALRYIDRFSGLFHQTMVGAGDYAKHSATIDNLMVGIEDCRAVFITYQSMRATEPVTYDIYPYGLIYHRGALYLVGRSVQRDEICHWKVTRIEAAELTPVHFQRPEGFDLRQHLAGSFGVYHGDGDVYVKVRFAASAARYVAESRWHDSQRLEPQKDGSLLAEFQLSDTEEIKRWILSFGPAAVVIEPEELRQEIASDLRAMLQAHAAPAFDAAPGHSLAARGSGSKSEIRNTKSETRTKYQ